MNFDIKWEVVDDHDIVLRSAAIPLHEDTDERDGEYFVLEISRPMGAGSSRYVQVVYFSFRGDIPAIVEVRDFAWGSEFHLQRCAVAMLLRVLDNDGYFDHDTWLDDEDQSIVSYSLTRKVAEGQPLPPVDPGMIRPDAAMLRASDTL